MTVASLTFPTFSVSCERSRARRYTPESLRDPIKELLSGETSPDHLTEFPGAETEGLGGGWIAYHFIWGLGGLIKWLNWSQFLSPGLVTWP